MPGRPAWAVGIVVEGRTGNGGIEWRHWTPQEPLEFGAPVRPDPQARGPVASPSAASRIPSWRRTTSGCRCWRDRWPSYYLIASASALLTGLGLVMVLSASSVTSYATSGSSFSNLRQAADVGGAGAPGAADRQPDVDPLAAAAVVSAAARVHRRADARARPGFGVSANGATRWIGFGSFTLQPSELAKLALCLWGADLLVRKKRRLGEWRHMLIPLLPIATLLSMLVMLEPDLGTTLIIVTVLMTLLWVVGAPARLFAGLLSVIGMLVTYLAVAEPYRLARLASFADPFKDSQDTGWQAVQGLYALASGGWWGVGLGASREKWSYLPNAHTDFIMAIIGEELGPARHAPGRRAVLRAGVWRDPGGAALVRSVRPAGRGSHHGVARGQALINMGAVVGLLPITGIPLPLISFGGSSLLITMFAIGILLSLAKTEPAAAQVIAARAASRSASRLAGRRARFGFITRRRAKKSKKGKGKTAGLSARSARSRAASGARGAGSTRKAGRDARGSGGRSGRRRGRLAAGGGSSRDGRFASTITQPLTWPSPRRDPISAGGPAAQCGDRRRRLRGARRARAGDRRCLTSG